jgi:RND family efflux transporter MFP subunit
MNKKTVETVIVALLIAILAGLGGYFFLHRKNAEPAALKAGIVYQCPMHPQIIRDKPGECPICGMALVPKGNEGPQTEKHPASAGQEVPPVFVDPAMVQKMGVTTDTARTRDLSKIVHAGGSIAVDETRLSVISCKISGWVEKLYVDYTGKPVSFGQRLLEIYSPDLVSAQEEYLQAFRASKASPQAGADLLSGSRNRLLNWDITETEIKALEARGKALRTMTIVSPSNGVVLEKTVQVGQNVTPGTGLYKIADISTIWVVASVYPMDLAFVRIAQEAAITLTYLRGKTFKGRVSFISPVLDSMSKTAQVRIEVHNTPDFALKPNMFADVDIQTTALVGVVAVPEQAVIRTGKRDLVVLSEGNGNFRPREVVLGVSAGGFVQIISGLKEGEVIVTSSQFLIDSESNIRAAIAKLAGAPASGSGENGAAPSPSPTAKPVKAVYTCPMHSQVRSDKPGKCPICGMDLVPLN